MEVNGGWLGFGSSLKQTFKQCSCSLSRCSLVVISCLNQPAGYKVVFCFRGQTLLLSAWLYMLSDIFPSIVFLWIWMSYIIQWIFLCSSVCSPLPLKHKKASWNSMELICKKKKKLSNVPWGLFCLMWANFLQHWHICYLCVQLKELSFAFVFVIEELITLICMYSRNCGWWCALIGRFFSGKSQ